MKDKEIKEVIKKVRELYRYDNEISNIVKQRATIECREDSKGNISLDKIEFSYYDTLYVEENSIKYSPEHGRSEILLTYSGWDGLLKL